MIAVSRFPHDVPPVPVRHFVRQMCVTIGQLCRLVDNVSLRIRGRWIMYPLLLRMLSWFCGLRWIQRGIGARESALVQQFLTETQLPIANPTDVVHLHLVALAWLGLVKHSDWTPRDFAQITTVHGWEHFHQAYQIGAGVI